MTACPMMLLLLANSGLSHCQYTCFRLAALGPEVLQHHGAYRVRSADTACLKQPFVPSPSVPSLLTACQRQNQVLLHWLQILDRCKQAWRCTVPLAASGQTWAQAFVRPGTIARPGISTRAGTIAKQHAAPPARHKECRQPKPIQHQ